MPAWRWKASTTLSRSGGRNGSASRPRWRSMVTPTLAAAIRVMATQSSIIDSYDQPARYHSMRVNSG